MRAWRGLIVLAAVFAAGCGVEVAGKGHGGPYSVEIRSVGDTQVYVVRGPENKVAAARAGGGTSAFLSAEQLQRALAAMPTPTPNPESGGDNVSIHAPGFNLQVQGDDVHVNESGHLNVDHTSHAAASTSGDNSGDDDNDHGGSGRVSMNIGGFGMHVDADDGGPGDADDRAQVTLTGMSAHDARHFIMEQDELSAQVQAQMIAALGLPADEPNAHDDDDGDRASDHLAGANNSDSKPKPDDKKK
jgi:hypothetical protein